VGDPLRALRDGRGLLETPAPLFGSQGSVLGHSCAHCFMPLNTIRFADLAETASRASLAKPNHPTDNTKPASPIALFSFLYVNRRRARQPAPLRGHPRGQKTKKLAWIATFLRLGIVARLQNTDLQRKTAGNQLRDSLFPLYGGEKESLIAKKLQKRPDFCFRN
jgi:hypothetical protein